MDILRLCLFMTLALTLLTNAVFSAPAPYSNDEIETMDMQEPEFDSDMVLVRDRRDANNDDGETEELLGRFRRQVAQMANSRRPYGSGRDHGRSKGRLIGRRVYHTRRGWRTRGRVVVCNEF